ncbi:hypothetical protein D3C86_1935600 [compost metagenome]
MGNARRHLSEDCQAVGLDQFLLHRLQPLARAPVVGDLGFEVISGEAEVLCALGHSAFQLIARGAFVGRDLRQSLAPAKKECGKRQQRHDNGKGQQPCLAARGAKGCV